jgi:hypothetical protein
MIIPPDQLHGAGAPLAHTTVVDEPLGGTTTVVFCGGVVGCSVLLKLRQPANASGASSIAIRITGFIETFILYLL